jgi:hypothetical protein
MFKKINRLLTIFSFLIINKKNQINKWNQSDKIVLVEFNNWALLHIAKYLNF